MRIIAGEFRSRRLKTLPGADLRPTPDKLRQALFNVLAHRLEGTLFLDAYAGSGAVGIEALSQGAARAIFLEKSRAAVRVIQENLAALGLEDRAAVVQGPAPALLAGYSADVVFLDPPYALEREYSAALRVLGANPPPLVLVQHSKHFDPGEEWGKLRRTRRLVHSENVISFYTPHGC